MTYVDPSECPICLGKNRCGNLNKPLEVKSSVSRCWCMDEKIDPKILESLTEEQRGKACICRACLQAFHRD